MAMDMMTDKDGDGIPDGAEITKRTTGTDGSVTTAKWVKGQMSMTNAAGDQITRGSVSPAAGSFDNTSMVRTNQPTFSQARLAEMGYTEANAPDYLRPGSSGGTMRMASASEMLGLNAPLESSDPRYEVRRARPGSNFTITRRLSDDEMKQKSAERFKMMELESAERRAQIAAQGGVDAAIAGRRQPDPYRPEPVSGPAGFLIPKPGGGWETQWRPQEPRESTGIVPPGSPGRMVPDPNDPTGQKFQPFEKPKAAIEYRPFMVGGKEVPGFAVPVDPATGNPVGEPFDYRDKGNGNFFDRLGITPPDGLQVPGVQQSATQPDKDPLEGRTATNARGQKLVRRNGQWVPAQ